MLQWKELRSRTMWNLGPLAASEVVREITGSPVVNVMGCCIGGTLLAAVTLALLAARKDKRFESATFMVSLQDSREGWRYRRVPG